MIAIRMKEAGVSMADVAWLKCMRNSEIALTARYRETQLRVRAQVQSFLVGQGMTTAH